MTKSKNDPSTPTTTAPKSFDVVDRKASSTSTQNVTQEDIYSVPVKRKGKWKICKYQITKDSKI